MSLLNPTCFRNFVDFKNLPSLFSLTSSVNLPYGNLLRFF